MDRTPPHTPVLGGMEHKWGRGMAHHPQPGPCSSHPISCGFSPLEKILTFLSFFFGEVSFSLRSDDEPRAVVE